MSNNWYRYSLRALVAAGSMAAFVGGWAALAEADRNHEVMPPAQRAAPAPNEGTDSPTLAPNRASPNPPPTLAPANRGSGLQPLPSQPQIGRNNRPRQRTGGS